METANDVKQLDDDQLQEFDWEFVDDAKRKNIYQYIDAEFPDGKFTFLDIGGGNGAFVDRVLEEYPHSQGVVLDNSELLIEKNKPHERKKVVLGSATDLTTLFDQKFDVIFTNYVLHHLVSDGYHKTRQNQIDTLNAARAILTDKGSISIFENIYDGFLLKWLPSYLIFFLTSAKFLAPLVRKLGANTAGIGVCFLSKGQWHKAIRKARLGINGYTDHRSFNLSLFKRVFLHLGNVRGGHFWCKPK